ncbi:hypothetical protein GOP47_0026987 [Adiantum capillus-veneris]|nr:hypothetical protein GOP47_0026987 [Adiantum capillus-veneris]
MGAKTGVCTGVTHERSNPNPLCYSCARWSFMKGNLIGMTSRESIYRFLVEKTVCMLLCQSPCKDSVGMGVGGWVGVCVCAYKHMTSIQGSNAHRTYRVQTDQLCRSSDDTHFAT